MWFSGVLYIFRLSVWLNHVKELSLPKGFYDFYNSVPCIQSKHTLCFQVSDLQVGGKSVYSLMQTIFILHILNNDYICYYFMAKLPLPSLVVSVAFV